jgi:serine/threonine protein kinase
MGLSPGTRLGAYEIVGLIGAGGMGEVYRARDIRLDRQVAIKSLRDALHADPERAVRFEREAKLLATLNHPGIATIHGLEEAGGEQFIVMELLDGETLQQRLTRGPLELPRLVEMGIALADALDAAHRAGIVHRDIKPANIFLTVHGPKIVDFGLAKAAPAVSTSGASHLPTLTGEALLTDPGTTVGTVAYMSPEQVRGEPIDARSDLFSLGAVLYEAAINRLAFGGATHGAIAGAVLYQSPPLPRQIRTDVPPLLEAAILKCLEKDRELRCQAAPELRTDLKRVKREIESEVRHHEPQPARHRTSPCTVVSRCGHAAIVRCVPGGHTAQAPSGFREHRCGPDRPRDDHCDVRRAETAVAVR